MKVIAWISLFCVGCVTCRNGPPPIPPYTPAPYINPHGHTPLPYSVTPIPYSPYSYTPAASYAAPPPVYHQKSLEPAIKKKKKEPAYATPACSYNTTKSWCLSDHDYPTYDVQHAIEYHYAAVASLYKDVIANTDNSVDRLKYLSEETYLCPSETGYVTPLRAINTEGKWSIIVNQVKAHYELLSQTVRVEECTTPGYKCPLVPECYETKCLQKHNYHRFLVYDPYDFYFPFSIESFKLPSACACYNGQFSQNH